jgi:hypothetical protein
MKAPPHKHCYRVKMTIEETIIGRMTTKGIGETITRIMENCDRQPLRVGSIIGEIRTIASGFDG